MSAEVKVVHMGRAAGKTTEALRKLHESGGGLFITTHGLEAMNVCRQHNFEGITILRIEIGTNVAIDDIDYRTGEIILASNRPVSLEYINKPMTAPNPHLKGIIPEEGMFGDG